MQGIFLLIGFKTFSAAFVSPFPVEYITNSALIFWSYILVVTTTLNSLILLKRSELDSIVRTFHAPHKGGGGVLIR